MSDFLSRLANRALGATRLAAPRRRSYFETVAPLPPAAPEARVLPPAGRAGADAEGARAARPAMAAPALARGVAPGPPPERLPTPAARRRAAPADAVRETGPPGRRDQILTPEAPALEPGLRETGGARRPPRGQRLATMAPAERPPARPLASSPSFPGIPAPERPAVEFRLPRLPSPPRDAAFSGPALEPLDPSPPVGSPPGSARSGGAPPGGDGPSDPAPRRRRSAELASEPVVQVKIGRIEVRVVPPPAAPARNRPPAGPVLKLGDYLRARNERRR